MLPAVLKINLKFEQTHSLISRLVDIIVMVSLIKLLVAPLHLVIIGECNKFNTVY